MDCSCPVLPCVHLRMDHESNGIESKEMNTEGQTSKKIQSPAVSKIIGRGRSTPEVSHLISRKNSFKRF